MLMKTEVPVVLESVMLPWRIEGGYPQWRMGEVHLAKKNDVVAMRIEDSAFSPGVRNYAYVPRLLCQGYKQPDRYLVSFVDRKKGCSSCFSIAQEQGWRIDPLDIYFWCSSTEHQLEYGLVPKLEGDTGPDVYAYVCTRDMCRYSQTTAPGSEFQHQLRRYYSQNCIVGPEVGVVKKRDAFTTVLERNGIPLSIQEELPKGRQP